MAHTTENANLVWQKVKAACDSLGILPVIQDELRRLKERLATVNGNPNIKFTPIDATATASADVVISDTANTALLALVLKKSTGTTVGYPSISDSASAIAAAKIVLNSSSVAPGKQLSVMYPKGLKAATGLTYNSVTAYNGTTASAAADQCNGFALSIDAEIS